jgi:CRP/FNR family transcriptional regulator
VSISSSEGRVVMLRMAQAGDVLGLNSALRDLPYDTTVKAVEPCRTDFISRVDLMDLIARSQTATYALLRLMSQELADITERTRSLLLPRTATGRLATLLLDWSKDTKSERGEDIRIDRLFTHEEIAQMICSSRETVTRLLANFSKREIIEVSSDSIVIRDLQELERIARE